MAPTFSIIIPVYNVAPYLRECLDSVLVAARTLESKSGVEVEERLVEIICVDDGSTDGSGAILDEYVEKGEKLGGGGQWSLKVIHQPNRGVSAARNAALDMVTGEWILFLDGDDIYTPNALLAIAQTIWRYPDVDCVKFGFATFTNFLEVKKNERPLLTERKYEVDSVVPVVAHQSLLCQCAYRSNTLGTLRFNTTYKDGEDNLFERTFIMTQAKSVAVTNAICYGYRQRATSQVHRPLSVKSMSDLINHRIDVLKVAIASPRRIQDFYDSDWIRNFLLFTAVKQALKLPADQREKILNLWKHHLPYLGSVQEFSMGTRLIFYLCNRYRGFLFFHVLRCAFLNFYDDSREVAALRKFVRWIKGSGEFSRKNRG